MQQPSPELLRRATAGDAGALEEVLRLSHGPVFSYLRRLVDDNGHAEDLAQEVLLRVAQGLAGFRGEARFTTWLFQIARHAAMDHLRRREAAAIGGPAEIEALLRCDPGMEGLEEAALLRACIGLLNEDLRSALVLRDMLGFKYEEIAEILQVTLATVKWRIFTAREQVQRSYRGAAGAERPSTLGGHFFGGTGS